MTRARLDRARQAIPNLLADGPLSTAELLSRLAERGVRMDAGELYLVCTENGLAEFDAAGQRWSAPGSVTAAPATPPARVNADRLRKKRSAPPLSIDRRHELEALRESVLRPSEAEEPTLHPVDPAWPEVAERARTAIRHELAAVTSRRTQQEIPLVAGEIIEEGPARMIVRYEIQSGDNVREGLRATLVHAEGSRPADPVEAEVLTQYGSEITLRLPGDSEFLESARLRCDLSWLVSRQIEAFTRFGAQPEAGFHSTAALAVIGTVGLLDEVPELKPHPVVGLTERQRLAVAHGMQPRVTWLWGPPGTGKTTTLAALLGELLDSGRSVLLAAPTNAAVDVALKALLARRPAFDVGEIVRLGATDDPGLSGRSLPVLVDEIAAAAGEEPARRLVRVQADLVDLRAKERASARRSEESAELTRQIADLTEFERQLQKLMREVREQVVRDAVLVACTTHQTLLQNLHHKDFDTVVIDEASMVTAAMAMLVAGAGEGHTVIAGDFRQLPPIAQAGSGEAREWVGNSVFERSGVAAAVRRGQPPANLVALDQQHRMRRQIGDAIGEAFYPEARLRTAPSVHSRPTRTVAAHEAQLVVIDTSRLAAPVARRGGSASRYNLQHAQLAANVVAHLRDAIEPASMGLISPFASQARLLQAFAPSDDDRVLASTVHRFQGAETDVVLYDAVDSTGSSLKPHRWFTETAMGSEGARLLNVAMSRAREQAILLADMAFLRRHCPPRTPVRTFFSHLAEYGDIRQWKDIVSAEGPTSLEADANQLLDDIGHAVTGIDIFTAATGGPLTRPIAEILGDTPEQVKISLWYRPDDRCADTLERPLRYHHTMLHPMRPVQESCVVVDSIVWSASGPILGRDPGVLLRTDHAPLADALRRQLLRRTVAGVPGTGEHAEQCACGSLRTREEVLGGPRAGVHSSCRTCRTR